MSLFTPVNQKPLTNVSVVRFKKAGKRFELACYPNKVNAYRQRLEKDLREVLQIPNIFTNVSKGQFAKREELLKCFDTEDTDTIAREILAKGDIQYSEKERQLEKERLTGELAALVASKCVDPASERCYSVATLKKAMAECQINVKTGRTAKQQVGDIIRELQASGHIRLNSVVITAQLHIPQRHAKKVRAELSRICEQIISDHLVVGEEEEAAAAYGEDTISMKVQVEPGNYEALEQLMYSHTKGEGRVTKLETTNMSQNDAPSQTTKKTDEAAARAGGGGGGSDSDMFGDDDNAVEGGSEEGATAAVGAAREGGGGGGRGKDKKRGGKNAAASSALISEAERGGDEAENDEANEEENEGAAAAEASGLSKTALKKQRREEKKKRNEQQQQQQEGGGAAERDAAEANPKKPAAGNKKKKGKRHNNDDDDDW